MGAVLLAGVVVTGNDAQAKDFPTRPITLIVPFAPGGTTDTVARILAQLIQTRTGNTLVVDNRAGASGSIGVAAVKRAQPDGYTLLFGIQDPVTIYPLLNKDVPYRAPRDFTPVLQFATANVAYFVDAKSPYKTLNDLVQAIKAKPGSITYASLGYGTTSHFALEMLKQTNGLDVIHVPYKGSGPQMQAVLSGEVTFTATTPVGAKAFIDSGQLRPLATTGKSRNPVIPQVPTIDETGLPPFTSEVWFGVLGPAKMPADVSAYIEKMFQDAVNSPEFKKQADFLGLDLTRPLSGDAFRNNLVVETQKWEQLVRLSNMKLEK